MEFFSENLSNPTPKYARKECEELCKIVEYLSKKCEYNEMPGKFLEKNHLRKTTKKSL